MKQLHQFSFLLLALLLPATAFAHDFEVDGIYYNINGNEVSVTYKGTSASDYYTEYSGSVTIPESVTYNGTTYSVTSIGNYAFCYCYGLTSIDIPNSITSIGYFPFQDCTGLTSIVVTSGNPTYDSRNHCNAIIETASNTLIVGCKNTVIPNSVTTIGNYAFYCSGLTSIDIPNSVTSIGIEAFDGCRSLTSVNISNSVTSIGSCAFYNCTSLACATIGNSVTSIGAKAFYGCRSLTDITLPNSVISIGMDAFEGTAWYDNQPDDLVYAGLVAYKYKGSMPSGTSITLRNGTLGIASNAFTYCSNLINIIIPNSVTSIGDYAFTGCSGLTSVEIPNSVTTIGNCAFSYCSGLTSVEIPNSVTTIGISAFIRCSGLTSVTIGNWVTSIGVQAFYMCDSLKDVYSYISDPSAITMGNYVFELERNPANYDVRTLHVPLGSVAAYQADTKWSQYFGYIVEMEAVLAESIKLNVTTAGLNEGATLQLTATVMPEECADKTVLWSSDNPSVATVDSNGLVTTYSVGTATITAMTTDGSNLSTTCTVTLLPVGVKGDVNGDSNISISDVTKLIDYLLSGSWN